MEEAVLRLLGEEGEEEHWKLLVEEEGEEGHWKLLAEEVEEEEEAVQQR